jgi:hypothetical protein
MFYVKFRSLFYGQSVARYPGHPEFLQNFTNLQLYMQHTITNHVSSASRTLIRAPILTRISIFKFILAVFLSFTFLSAVSLPKNVACSFRIRDS